MPLRGVLVLLEAFRVGGSVGNVLLVFAVNQVAGAVPLTPGGAGVQQALLVKVFAASAAGTAAVAAYSVGQQIAIAAFTAAVGLGAVVLIFGFRSFGEVLHAGRASREAERAGTPLVEDRSPYEDDPPPPPAPRLRARYELLKPLARLAHERDGLGEHPRHDRPDLLRLGLGAALQVDALDCRDGHVDRQLDRVVRPRQALVALHLLGELGQAALQLLGISKQVAETATLHLHIIDCPAHAPGRGDPPAGGARVRAPRAPGRARVRRRLSVLPGRDHRHRDAQLGADGRPRAGARPGAVRASQPGPQPARDRGKYISHHALALIAGSVVKSLALIALTLILLLLLDATRFRRPQTWSAARPLVLVGGIGLAVVNVAHQVVGAIQAHSFAVGHDFSNHAVEQALTRAL